MPHCRPTLWIRFSMGFFRLLLRRLRIGIASRAVAAGVMALGCVFTPATLLSQGFGSEAGAVSLPQMTPVSDSASVAATVAAYHRALAAGDSATALSFLAEDALILESGGMETRVEYRAHHLPSDIEFARAIQSTESSVRVKVRGDVAWAASTSVTQGEFRGRAINSAGAELMVLTRHADGWKIAAIHWSSRTRRP